MKKILIFLAILTLILNGCATYDYKANPTVCMAKCDNPRMYIFDNDGFYPYRINGSSAAMFGDSIPVLGSLSEDSRLGYSMPAVGYVYLNASGQKVFTPSSELAPFPTCIEIPYSKEKEIWSKALFFVKNFSSLNINVQSDVLIENAIPAMPFEGFKDYFSIMKVYKPDVIKIYITSKFISGATLNMYPQLSYELSCVRYLTNGN